MIKNVVDGKKGRQPAEETADAVESASEENHGLPREIGGPRGPEPTRYGDWEVKGRCSDF
ncbi:DUF1674 domain-containing protein [Natronospira bacteriovora]|uniref:DUF1674 domain-containing protein n=1 Tax=Natronospira bacteriovora TaxID=3069753 RepID=A0ABU0W2R5_9GAMM|nr:succinate dehydrogenase assembly factor 4 [Natronospira sp. AB-CW4]MDQ2068302.1 DUF1674 domain-containing protein [Natronospira sp. AB-CW4]